MIFPLHLSRETLFSPSPACSRHRTPMTMLISALQHKLCPCPASNLLRRGLAKKTHDLQVLVQVLWALKFNFISIQKTTTCSAQCLFISHFWLASKNHSEKFRTLCNEEKLLIVLLPKNHLYWGTQKWNPIIPSEVYYSKFSQAAVGIKYIPFNLVFFTS